VSVPNVMALPLADADDATGEPETTVTAVLLPIVGDIEAIVLLLIPPEDAETLCGLLGVEADSEVGLSALSEIGNILGCAYVGAFGAMASLQLEPRPPETISDMLGAVVSSVLAAGAAETDTALLLDSTLLVEGTECSMSFMLVPNREGIADVLSRLGFEA
jgi:chemotaxis protein CheC